MGPSPPSVLRYEPGISWQPYSRQDDSHGLSGREAAHQAHYSSTNAQPFNVPGLKHQSLRESPPRGPLRPFTPSEPSQNGDVTTDNDSAASVVDYSRISSTPEADPPITMEAICPRIMNEHGFCQDRTTLPPIIDLFSLAARSSVGKTAPPKQKPIRKRQRHDVKVWRKWSDKETKDLFRGIQKHGLGNWKVILDDKEFEFDNRTAANLKDRFRTCYPGGLPVENAVTPLSPPLSKEKRKSSELHDPRVAATKETSPPCPQSALNVADGTICGPLKRSQRRQRRPFTARDDWEILEGIRRYGPAWAKIQRHLTFHLSCRQPMDLRDRIRNRFPDLYKRLDKNGPRQRQEKASWKGA